MRLSFFCCAIIFISSCSVEPKPIDYNLDQCSACKMMISEQQFGAELVTTKGKVFKFDAIECMIPEIENHGVETYAHILVTDFKSPGKFIDAKTSSYLISPLRPSPMGKNISAYPSPNEIEEEFKDPQSKILNWEQLLSHSASNTQ